MIVFTLLDIPANGHSQIMVNLLVASNTVGAVTNVVAVSPSSLIEATPADNTQTVVTAIVDTDNDQIPDMIDPDDDNDGMTDTSEQIAGTDQFDAASLFVVELKIPDSGIYLINYQSVSGRIYQLKSATNLLDQTSWQNEGPQFFGDGQVQQISVAPVESTKFFRLEVLDATPPP